MTYNAKLTIEEEGSVDLYVVNCNAMYATAIQGFNASNIDFVHDESHALTFHKLEVYNEANQLAVIVNIS